ncbi:hypothetical protein D3C86_2210640 [compost metagenome]
MLASRIHITALFYDILFILFNLLTDFGILLIESSDLFIDFENREPFLKQFLGFIL